MKKILILSILAISSALAPESMAQNAVMRTAATSGADSVRAGGTTPAYLYIKPTAAYKCASYQANYRRITAAIGGTVVLEGSNDGSNWFSASVAAGDTITVTNAATGTGVIKTAPVTGVLYQFYRFKCVGLVNDTLTLKGWFNGRQ